jgi:hypothetical protein
MKPYARGKKCRQGIFAPAAGAVLAATGICALLLTGSPAWTLIACAACGAVICIAPAARKEWRKYQAGRALARWLATTARPGRHACGRPGFHDIILDSYTRAEIDELEQFGEVLRLNRRHP